ncbi:MAG: SDR family NAD(P)-dependent oxidoreductase [Chloroflexi bacterium]|nr:MAG: SDR family NAD(P)-dependent oxidoreductase [Chloroflexota bacterium]
MNTSTTASKSSDIPGFVDRIVRPLTHLFNPLILRIAGGRWFPMFSLLHHRGHKSGRIYATPVTGFPRGGFFWLGLAFGQNSGWARNVLAAGDAYLRYRGSDYHLVEATVVATAEVADELPRVVRLGAAAFSMPRGIGPHLASALAGGGMNLVLTGRSGSELEAVAADQRKHGARVLTVVADLLDDDARTLLIGAAQREFGGVDVLVNNAGGDPLRQFEEMSIEENESIIKLNLFAPIALSHLVLPGMLERGRGHIVNISAMAGRVGFPYTEAYAAAKDGLIGFSRVLRTDYRARGVSSSVLILGAIAGAGQGQRTMDQMRMPKSSFMAPVGLVAKALLKAIDKDKAEIVVQPGPGRMLRAVMDFYPGLGPWMNNQMGVNRTLREIQDFRKSQTPAGR